ncbi:MAG: molecular chaperone HtpG, partial [Thalassobaculaceae bacterium]
MAAEKRAFQAEVSKLLHIVANSLYSEREVFLRELISNASDACDKLRYLALTAPELAAADSDYRITLAVDKAAKILTITDNGVGMSGAEMEANLGTIARSGTESFVADLQDEAAKDHGLIGRFGVGFYAAFMVAGKVEVLSRKAGEEAAATWSSDGLGEYEIGPAEKAERGTVITLHLKADAEEFLEDQRLRHIVKTYSDHISIPIMLITAPADGEDDAAPASETLNQASALWTRSKSEIEETQYTEFYHHVAHAFDDPWLTVHWRAEGVIEYAALLFVPGQRPFDLFHPDRKNRLKLYVKRVFITDDCEELVPSWLRFVKGVVDCEDLPLNVSREMLQNNPVLAKIKSGLVKRVLSELSKKADKAPEEYAGFWDNFGAVLKEGLYADGDEHRETLLALTRFKSTEGDGLVSLAEYVARMKPGQDAIYYITGENHEAVAASPHLEGFKAKGVEVLLLSDPIDDFWISAMFDGFEGKPFKSATRGGTDLSKIDADGEDGDAEKDAAKEDADKVAETELAPFIASLKLALSDSVKDVRESER